MRVRTEHVLGAHRQWFMVLSQGNVYRKPVSFVRSIGLEVDLITGWQRLRKTQTRFALEWLNEYVESAVVA